MLHFAYFVENISNRIFINVSFYIIIHNEKLVGGVVA